MKKKSLRPFTMFHRHPIHRVSEMWQNKRSTRIFSQFWYRFEISICIYLVIKHGNIIQFLFLQDRARNVSERFTSTTTLTVNIRDDDDQDPSFIYQGCMLLDGACINPEYSASVRIIDCIVPIKKKKSTWCETRLLMVYRVILTGNRSGERWREFSPRIHLFARILHRFIFRIGKFKRNRRILYHYVIS